MAALYEDILGFVANNLKCSICLEMFTDPVTLTCGHSYCLKCIKDHLGRNQNRTCPQCRVPLPQKYNLKKNVTICNLLGLHDAGGREMWDQILTDQENRKDMLMRRLNFMKEEIKRIEAELNIEHQERYCFTRTPDTSSSSSSLEVSNSSLDSNGADNSSSDLQSAWEESLEGSSQVDEFENMESDPGENLLDSDSLAAGFNSCRSSEFKAAALSGAFVSLSFSPQLGHRRLVFLPVRRRMEVSSSPSLRMQNGRFRACQWMADQEFATGRHYWDVETGGCSGWAAGLAYATLARDEQLGRGRESWCIEWSSGRFSAWHNNTETPLKQVYPSRVRVLLDMDAGQLSFWTVGDTVAELHSIPVEFSAPVRPIFWLFGTKQGNFLSFPRP